MRANIVFNPISKLDNGVRYRVRIGIPESIGFIRNVELQVNTALNDFYKHVLANYKESNNGYAFFEVEIDMHTQTNFRYYVSFNVNKETYFIDKNLDIRTYIGINDLSKMSVNFSVPKWGQGEMVYHIFVDRFNRGSKELPEDMPRRYVHKSFDEEIITGKMDNPDGLDIQNFDFYGGDLKGVTDKLDYIKSLGVSIIYLSPILESQSNHGYDTGDYMKIDPYKGTFEDLNVLCDEAHKRGMKIVLDVVFNHTGNDSIYFNQCGTYPNLGAYQSEESEYYSWFCPFYKDGVRHFDTWWGMPTLPKTNQKNREFVNFICGDGGVLHNLIIHGVDGFRFDVVENLDDDFICEIYNSIMKYKPDALLVGEIWEDYMKKNRRFTREGHMHTAMNYYLMNALMRYFKYQDAYKINYVLQDILNEYADETMFSAFNATSTHDISRLITIMGSPEFLPDGDSRVWDPKCRDHEWSKRYRLTREEYKRGLELAREYIYTLAFLPGNLTLFYGDELGVEGMGNICTRMPFNWKEVDNPNNPMLSYIRWIGRIRNDEDFLKNADLRVLDINKNFMMFERTNGDTSSLTIVNPTSDHQDIILPGNYTECSKIYRLKNSNTRTLAPHGAITLRK